MKRVKAVAAILAISAGTYLDTAWGVNAQTAGITIREVRSTEDIPQTPPAEGHYRVHMIDVGTGLSILLQGHTWTLLFDAGSADDKSGNQNRGDSKSRVIAYLYHAIGKSGARECVPAGEGLETHSGAQLPIDHLVLSHPHEDHGVMMDDVLDCYNVRAMWDSGRSNDTVFYGRILERVAQEPDIVYNTAKAPNNPKTIRLPKRNKRYDFTNVNWQQFTEGQKIALDANASFTILHAEGSKKPDPNENSIVMRVDLGAKSILLTGDAESGPRKLPTEPVADIEKHLIDHHASLIDVDILQVGHHGSLTSTRGAFVSAVSPSIALISAGPKKYKSVVLPDVEIVDHLTREGIKILRTDIYDETGCPVADRVGRDKTSPGGCANFILEW